MKPRHKRFAAIAVGIAALGAAAGLVLSALNKNLVFFFTPSQVAANEAPRSRDFRIGGLVVPGSLKRQQDGYSVQFIVTDTARSIKVNYRGTLPDLFREGKGVVAQGHLGPDGIFQASEVLAKHDANYMPPEAADAVKRARAMVKKTSQTLVTDPPDPVKKR
ncbi:MAG TPA: cytochrome c maturation protein CcmE [Burkholderiales bacterium]|nr:cytochrome c maturation protein CcmE [Burkholderiales bacterium]